MSVVLEVEGHSVVVDAPTFDVEVQAPIHAIDVAVAGQPGPPGAPGQPGTDGVDGAPGAPGEPGADYDPAEADLRYVNVDGDAMGGPLVLAADPTAALHAATRQYVDAVVTVSDSDPSGVPARDGLLWVKV